jgi:hypothetical protein
MGNLPESQVNPSPPFSHTGVDYAGPCGIIPFVGRGQRIRKHYVALFVYLITKAIHLESVKDYTTTGFLAAFRRFVSRRGLLAYMYSDNGTNFHGADRELQTSFRAISSATLWGTLGGPCEKFQVPSAASSRFSHAFQG